MNDAFQPLPQLKIASPCHESWDEMSGSDQSRFCSQCEKSVFNFTEMTSREVQEVLDSKQSVCARMRRRENGSIITRDCETSSPAITRREWFSQFFSLATMVLAMGTLVGCGRRGDGNTGEEAIMGIVPEPEIMGDLIELQPMGEVRAQNSENPNAEYSAAGSSTNGDHHTERGTLQGKVQVSPTELPQ